MASNYGAKKPFGKQKTYGKAVKSHLNGWFGRSLWSELDNSPGANSERNEPAQAEDTPTKESFPVKEDKAFPPPPSTDAVIAVEEEEVVVAKGPSSDELDNIVNQLDDLGITEDASPPSPSEPIIIVEHRTSAIIAQDLHSQSSVGSLRESSDKENEFGTSTAATPAVPHTSQKLGEPEQTSYPETASRSVLRECESPSVKESPPRKRGLRKRVSASAAGAPSPLRSESVVKDDRARDVAEDSIKVWEDEVNEAVAAPERNFAIVIESRARSATVTPKVSTPKASTPKSSTPKDEIPAIPAQNYAEESIFVTRGEFPFSRTPTPKTEAPETPAKSDTEDSIVSSPVSVVATDSTLPCANDAAVHALYGDEITGADVLLELCTEREVLEFDQYIDSLLENSSIRKLGEASYSEVFLQSRTDSDSSTTVLKIIPFGQEDQCEIKSIIQEVRISKTMAEIEGFIGFRG